MRWPRLWPAPNPDPLNAPVPQIGTGVTETTPMNQMLTTLDNGPALRLELIRLLLPVAGRDVVTVARDAEAYIVGPMLPLYRFDPVSQSVEHVTTGSESAAEAETKTSPLAIDAPKAQRVGDPAVLAAVQAMVAQGIVVKGRTLAESMGCSQVTASTRLRVLEQDGSIRREGKSFLTHYVLTEDGSPALPEDGSPSEIKEPLPPPEEARKPALDGEPKATLLAATHQLGTPEGKMAIPTRPILPEDRLRSRPAPEPAAPASLDTVAEYLRGCGQDVARSEDGSWTSDGCTVPPRRLLAAANQYRTANSLPPFSVRGI